LLALFWFQRLARDNIFQINCQKTALRSVMGIKILIRIAVGGQRVC